MSQQSLKQDSAQTTGEFNLLNRPHYFHSFISYWRKKCSPSRIKRAKISHQRVVMETPHRPHNHPHNRLKGEHMLDCEHEAINWEQAPPAEMRRR
ncbi:MAG: hypothetical protein ACJAVI_003656 [Candidatus Azotimanducaceae bacterium]|jgi:hypothetical protein